MHAIALAFPHVRLWRIDVLLGLIATCQDLYNVSDAHTVSQKNTRAIF